MCVRPRTRCSTPTTWASININQGGRGVFADGTPVPVVDKSTLTISQRGRRAFSETIRASVQGTRRSLRTGWENIGRRSRPAHTIVKNIRLIDGSVVVDDPQYTTAPPPTTQTVKRGRHPRTTSSVNMAPMDATKTYFNYSEGFNPNIGVVDQDGHSLTAPQFMKAVRGRHQVPNFLGGAIGFIDLQCYNSPHRKHPGPDQLPRVLRQRPVRPLKEYGPRKGARNTSWWGEILSRLERCLQLCVIRSRKFSDPNYTFPDSRQIRAPQLPARSTAPMTSLGVPLRGFRAGFRCGHVQQLFIHAVRSAMWWKFRTVHGRRRNSTRPELLVSIPARGGWRG